VTHNEGSTFRWLVTECNGCGAQCGEERIDTMTMERGAAIEQAKEAAIGTWNTRVALEQQAEPVETYIHEYRNQPHPNDFGIPKGHWWQAKQYADAVYTTPPAPQQQAEPVAMRMPKVGDRVICLEDESLGTVESLTAGGSPDITFDDGSRGTYLLREFAELFGYAAPPKRQWVGLEAEDLAQIESDEFWQVGNHMAIAMAVEEKLKERNNG
jgi:hypothetical protein